MSLSYILDRSKNETRKPKPTAAHDGTVCSTPHAAAAYNRELK